MNRPRPAPPSAPRLVRGVHLLELLAALMLLSVLATLAWPPWQRALRHLQAESLRAELVSSLVMARSTAITRQRRVTVCALADGQQCGQDWSQGWRVQLDPRASGNAPGAPLRVHQPRNLRVQLLSSEHRPHVQFRADGRNAGSNQSLVLCVDGREHSRVIISVPGRIRAQRPRTAQSC